MSNAPFSSPPNQAFLQEINTSYKTPHPPLKFALHKSLDTILQMLYHLYRDIFALLHKDILKEHRPGKLDLPKSQFPLPIQKAYRAYLRAFLIAFFEIHSSDHE